MRVVLFCSLVALVACSSPSSQPWNAEGPIQAMDGETWVVAGQLVAVPPDASTAGTPRIGSVVRLSGTRTSKGELRADSIEVLDAPAKVATPAPTVRAAPAKPTPARRGNNGHNNDEGD